MCANYHNMKIMMMAFVQYCAQICQNWRVELYNYHYAWTVIRFISQNKAV